ncbi:testis-expressed protein 13B [Tursiops truncatus]|uniref:testis-expressed protein 13B n=1 Tax=Tursiops truncatus TaxID=9739 RepID=UPI003CCF7AF3
MALKLEDPGNGFRHGKVVAFINESMARHEKGSAFYLENISLSWAAVEDKLQAILEDHQVSSEAKEACVWGSLALGMRFFHRQSHLHWYRVEWLYYLAKLHKSVARALVSDMKLLKAQQDVERKETASLLQQAHARLAEVQEERDLLRWKLLQAESVAKGPGLATASGTGQKEHVRRKKRQRPLLLLQPLLEPQEEEENRRTWKGQKLPREQRSCVETLCSFSERTHVLPTSSTVHSRSSISDVSLLGAL